MNGELIVVDDVPGAFSETVISSYASRLEETFALALSGGPTAKRSYERLAEEAGGKVDWWDVDFYWSDERCVPPDHPDSNQRMGREALVERVGGANAVYPMSCDEGTEAYQMRVAEVGHFDLIHLGLGPDGHTASLFPGSPALGADRSRLVVLNHDPSGNNPHRRMTFTLTALARSRLVVFTVSGESKAEAMLAVRKGEAPAAQVTAEKVLWLVDRAAAPWG